MGACLQGRGHGAGGITSQKQILTVEKYRRSVGIILALKQHNYTALLFVVLALFTAIASFNASRGESELL
jgi:hypothetical protein